MDDRTDRLPRGWPDDVGRGLSPREQETTGELRLMDPQLADLYEHGISLLRQDPSRPGDICLLAHCGRELSRGVVELLLDDETGISSQQTGETYCSRIAHTYRSGPHRCRKRRAGEVHRSRIARALGLPETDPRVSEWHKLHRHFSASVHWRYPSPSPERARSVRDAFERFSSMLYGRIAPYFSTESELDSLLTVNAPTRAHARKLSDLQLRLAQRRYFFGRLTNSAWVEPLTNEGFFRNPPVRQVNPDQSWRARAWPEGYYLANVAIGAPDAVADILEAVPSSNDNPVVWDVVAKAARQMPPDVAVRMVPSVTNALKRLPTAPYDSVFANSVVNLAVSLAEAKRCEAFDLVSHLFYVVDKRHLPDGPVVRTDSVFPRLGPHRYDQLCSRIVTALESLDPERTLCLLLEKIQRIQRLADAKDCWDLKRLEAWGVSAGGDMRLALVASVTKLACRMAEGGPDAWGPERVMETIDSYRGELFSRIRYLFLVRVGDQLREWLDQVLQSEEARDPGFHVPEFAAFLRAQFRNASEGARKRYAKAVKAESIPHVQRRILMFFRGDVPEEFEGLAREHRVLGLKPSYEEQQVAEVGICSEARVWSRDESPVSAEQLSAWTVAEVVAFLREFQPSQGSESVFGLQHNLTVYAQEHPADAVSVLNLSVDEAVNPSAVEGILHGLGDAVGAGADLDWHQTLSGLGKVIRHVAALDGDGPGSFARWRRTAGRAMWPIEQGCRRDAIPSDFATEIWDLLNEATTTSEISQKGGPPGSSLRAVITAQLNDTSGNVATAVLSAAFWDYRRQARIPDSSDEAEVQVRGAVQRSLLPILDRWLQDEGPCAAVPLAWMGDYLPQLHLLAPEWIKARASDLLQGGLEDPVRRPTWTTYVSHARLYDAVFLTLRAWYVRAAEGVVGWASATDDSTNARKPSQGLAVHLVGAVLRGLVSVGDEDRLLETAYANLSPSDWGHAYRSVFLDWKAADQPAPKLAVRRLVDLWAWRISELRDGEASDHAMEEAQALWWLFLTPYIPAPDLIRLGRATARLARGRVEAYLAWERLHALAESDADGVFEMVDRLLRAPVYVPVEDVRPVLAHILKIGTPETQSHARRLINRLGERGFRQLKDLG